MSICVCNASSCVTLWHVPIIPSSSFSFVPCCACHQEVHCCQQYVAVPFAIVATACKTEQTRWQMHLGKLQDSPLYRLSITCWGTHRASADCLRVLALCQMQPNWIHPCRVCIRQYSSQCQRDPHLFRDTGHGGSHSRVGVHACPAEAL